MAEIDLNAALDSFFWDDLLLPEIKYRTFTDWHDIPIRWGNAPVVFDIETGPRRDINWQEDFNPNDAPLGNATKPETVAKKIAEYQEKWLSEAALRVEHLEVITIQFKTEDSEAYILEQDQDGNSLAHQFWQVYYEQCQRGKNRLIGYAIDSFDVPVLVRLAWMNGLYCSEVLTPTGYLVSDFVDLRRRWQVGDRQFKSGGALKTAKILGCRYLKTMEDGSRFADIYYEDRPLALEYAASDVYMEWEMAEKMRVV